MVSCRIIELLHRIVELLHCIIELLLTKQRNHSRNHSPTKCFATWGVAQSVCCSMAVGDCESPPSCHRAMYVAMPVPLRHSMRQIQD